MERLLSDAEDLRAKLVEWRRGLHKNAEVGFELPNTVAFLCEKLREIGYEPTVCGRSSVVVSIGRMCKKGANKGLGALLLRADTDGLPIREKTGLPFASKTGNMHACGHDMHAAMLLGAAKLLKARERELRGEIRLLFQAAEETLSGAKEAIEDGVLKGVSRAAMLHVLTDALLETGTVVVSSAGASAPAADYFRITVKGKACHGSSPQNGVDALTAAAHILVALEEIPARELSPASPAVLTVGKLQGGKAGNAIADSAELEGTLRTFDEEGRYALKRRIEEISTHVAKAFRATAKTHFPSGCPALVNDGAASEFAFHTARKLLGETRVHTSAELSGGSVAARNGGSEDFAYIAAQTPSVMLALAAGESDKGYAYPLHHPKARFDESALPVGAALYAALALAYEP